MLDLNSLKGPKKSGLIIVISALFLVAAFIELSYGSFHLGMGFLVLTCLVFYLGIKDKKIKESKVEISYFQVMLGVLIILAVIVYNIYKNSEIQTFDSMVLLLGFSLILLNVKKFTEIGRFALYFSIVFLIFYINLFLIPEKLGISLSYYYGHYFVTLPVVTIMQSLGYNVSIPVMRIIEVHGVEYTTLKIDLACFGWYSLLLIVSMVISYSETIEKIQTKRLVLILLALAVASYIANLLRVAILVYLAYFYGLKTMMTIHSHLGWILFAILLLPIAFFMLKERE
ncbi:MAG: archaeosortase C [Archaeoglobus sp.]|nr:archaeosortase C [Archaeoglobus sp.]